MWTVAGQLLRWLFGKGISFVLILAVLVGAVWIGLEQGAAERLLVERSRLVTDVQLRDETVTGFRRQVERVLANADDLRRKLRFEEFELDYFRTSLGKKIQDEEARRDAIRRENPLKALIPFTDAWKQLRYQDALLSALRQFATANDDAMLRLRADPRWQQVEALARSAQDIEARIAGEQREIAAARARIAALTTDYDRILVKKETFDSVGSLVRGQVPLALAILVAAILVPVAIKLLCYFAIAPLAARFAPIHLLPDASGRYSAHPRAGNDPGHLSAVSMPILLAPGTELLVRPDFLQSTSTQDTKRTQWLLDARHPFTSLASGLFALIRIRAGGDAQPIVVSSTRDPLSEVGALELPAGSAVVCQPRALAGMVKPIGGAPRISRHWRLGSLHAWLTFQLRFLVFHGPCTLVLKGCRGIRVEDAQAQRMINQAATLGFSANLAYANRRCETFVAYWTGSEDLFNDVFVGSPGFFVYEEMPSLRRKSGVTGRGIEGILDAFLKVFGV